MLLICILYLSVVVYHVHKHALYSQFNAPNMYYGSCIMTYFQERKKILGGVIIAVYSIFIECAVSDRVETPIIGFL